VVQADTAVPGGLAQYFLINLVHIPMVIKGTVVVVVGAEMALAMLPVVVGAELDYLVKDPMVQVAQVPTMEMVIKHLLVGVEVAAGLPEHLVLVRDMLEMLVLVVHMVVVVADTVLTTAEHLRPVQVEQFVSFGLVHQDNSPQPA
jgi:hypothetical protein